MGLVPTEIMQKLHKPIRTLDDCKELCEIMKWLLVRFMGTRVLEQLINDFAIQGNRDMQTFWLEYNAIGKKV